jgi:hypothetical protein
VLTIEDIAANFGKKLARHIEGEYAEIGKLESDGTYTVRVENPNNLEYLKSMIYIRIGGRTEETVEAFNVKTAWKAKLGVMARIESDGFWYVLGVAAQQASIFAGEAAGAMNLPPMAVAPDMILPSKQFEPGRVRPLNGDDLQVWIEEFAHGEDLLGGVSFDLSGVSITAAKKAPVVISVDPADNSVTATKGTEVGLAMLVTRADALAVAIPGGEVKLWAYVLANGDTVLPSDGSKIFDLRDWLGGSGSSGSGGIVTQPSTITGAQVIDTDRNAVFAGDITVTGTLTVNGTMAIVG